MNDGLKPSLEAGALANLSDCRTSRKDDVLSPRDSSPIPLYLRSSPVSSRQRCSQAQSRSRRVGKSAWLSAQPRGRSLSNGKALRRLLELVPILWLDSLVMVLNFDGAANVPERLIGCEVSADKLESHDIRCRQSRMRRKEEVFGVPPWASVQFSTHTCTETGPSSSISVQPLFSLSHLMLAPSLSAALCY